MLLENFSRISSAFHVSAGRGLGEGAGRGGGRGKIKLGSLPFREAQRFFYNCSLTCVYRDAWTSLCFTLSKIIVKSGKKFNKTLLLLMQTKITFYSCMELSILLSARVGNLIPQIIRDSSVVFARFGTKSFPMTSLARTWSRPGD